MSDIDNVDDEMLRNYAEELNSTYAELREAEQEMRQYAEQAQALREQAAIIGGKHEFEMIKAQKARERLFEIQITFLCKVAGIPHLDLKQKVKNLAEETTH